MPHARIAELFVKQGEGAITLTEWHELRELLLAEGHHYGDILLDYVCPNQECRKPLLFSWYNGLICWHAQGGCGWHFPLLSPRALRETKTNVGQDA